MPPTNLPSPQPTMPPSGVTFHTTADNPLLVVSHDLCRITAFLQERNPCARVFRLDDWWQHDGLYFERGPTDLHQLFQLVESPRSLLHSSLGESHVFVGVGAADRSCYLRFFADWDDRGDVLLGEYSLTICEPGAEPFEVAVVPTLESRVLRENAEQYFTRIRA